MFKGRSAILTSQNVWISSNIITGQLYQKSAGLLSCQAYFFLEKAYHYWSHVTGCKENHFYSLPFGKAEASSY